MKLQNIIKMKNNQMKINLKMEFIILKLLIIKKITIYHLVIANEDSDDGKIFNEYAYNFIENLYKIIPNPQKFDIIEEVKNEFIDIASKILNYNKEKIDFNSNEEILKSKIIKLNLNANEELNLNTFDDIKDESKLRENEFKPKYNYFIKNKNILEIRLEIPGNAICNAISIVEKDLTKIIVSGIKKMDIEPEKLEDNIDNIRLFTDFKTIISLPVEKYQITSEKPKEGYPKFINGICIIQYDLKPKSIEQSTEVVGVQYNRKILKFNYLIKNKNNLFFNLYHIKLRNNVHINF